jgi:ParB family chromosome partitioning protein
MFPMMMAPQFEKGRLYDIPITDLRPDPNQPRKSIDPQALEELVASIRTHGIIQPILFRTAEGGWLTIVAGERRFQAARIAGISMIPGICVEGNTSGIALIENMLRQDLTPIEEAEGLQRLMDEQDYTQEELGGIIGKAQNTLSEILSLNKLPEEIRNECRGDRTIPRSALVSIAKKKQERSMMTAAYRAGLQKVNTARRPTNPNEPRAALALMKKAAAKIQSLDTSAWTEEDSAAFQEALTSLKTEIDNYLTASSPVASTNLA